MKKNRRSILFILISMAMIAVTDGMKGILMPVFMDTFQVQSTQMSLMMMLSSVGYILAAFFGAMLCEKLGHRRVLFGGILTQLLSILAFTQMKSFGGLLGAMFFLSLGNGVIGISLNTMIPLIAVASQAVFMNVSHFCYGLGLTGIQKIGGILLFHHVDFHRIYFGIFFICMLYMILFFLTPLYDVRISTKNIKKKPVFNLTFLLMAGTLSFYAFAEALMSAWFINYMVKGFALDMNRASTYAAVFLLLFSLGRLFGGFVVEKGSITKSIGGALFLGSLFCLAGLLLSNRGFLLLAISGLFFSIVYPTCILWIAKLYPENSISMTGIITTLVSLHNMLFVFLLGRLNDLISISAGFWMLFASIFIAFLSALFLSLRTKAAK